MDFNSKQARAERIRWFQHDRFGMFIHWGLYAIPGARRVAALLRAR